MISSPKRLGALALLASIALTACSSGGASTAPSAAAPTTAPTTAASAPDSGAPSSAAPSAAAGPVVPTASVKLQGAGATFPAPLYTSWFQTYNGLYPNIQIDYTANGSGAGITAITQQTVDFGASDAAMKDTEMAALPAGKKLFHFPTALGAVVAIYNLDGVPKLQLDSANLAEIFLGKITNWNDPKIAANNPGVTLPNLAILVVHRSDGSGTTNTFTTYLDTVDPTWHSSVGAGKSVKWPVGIGASGNDGVATAVKQTPGAIGYVDLSVAVVVESHLGLCQECGRELCRRLDRRRHRSRRVREEQVPGRLPRRADHQRGRRHHVSDRLVHLPSGLRGPDRREQGSGPRRVHLLGADRWPGRRGAPGIRAAAGRYRPASADPAPSRHHGRSSDLALKPDQTTGHRPDVARWSSASLL